MDETDAPDWWRGDEDAYASSKAVGAAMGKGL